MNPAPTRPMSDLFAYWDNWLIKAEYQCEGKELTVEIMDTDGTDCMIASNQFPLAFVRHQGWLPQPTMTVNKKHLKNIRKVCADGRVEYPQKVEIS